MLTRKHMCPTLALLSETPFVLLQQNAAAAVSVDVIIIVVVLSSFVVCLFNVYLINSHVGLNLSGQHQCVDRIPISL